MIRAFLFFFEILFISCLKILNYLKLHIKILIAVSEYCHLFHRYNFDVLTSRNFYYFKYRFKIFFSLFCSLEL